MADTASLSTFFSHWNALRLFQGLRGFRNCHDQRAIANSGLDVAFIHITVERDLALKPPVEALTEGPVFGHVLGSLFAAQRQHALML